MKSIHFSDVIVPENRQRKEFSEPSLAELADGFRKPHGQLQPIVLRNDGKTLVCGERRLRAIQKLPDTPITHAGVELPAGHLAYITLGELSEEQLYEAELEENVQREDLTWQERAKAMADLHNLRVARIPEHTIADTAKEIFGEAVSGHKKNKVSSAIQLAEFLDDPLVAAAPDEKTARKAIKEVLKSQQYEAASANFDETKAVHQLYQSSCYDTNVKAFANTFDTIITDPPYGIDIHKKDTFDGDKHEYDDSDNAFKEVIEKLPALSFATAKKDAHIYVFCDIKRFVELFVAFELAGWTVWPRPIIWDKGNTGSYGNIEYGFRACYDAILFARKGDKKLNAGYRDVISINQTTDHRHPAGKPVDLYKELIKRSCFPGDVIADFYCGGGPIFPAAAEMQCIAHGWEINQTYHNMANTRRIRASGGNIDPGF